MEGRPEPGAQPPRREDGEAESHWQEVQEGNQQRRRKKSTECVLTAKGKEEMHGEPLKRLVEVGKAGKNHWERGFPHLTNTIQKEAEVIYPSKNQRIISIK